MKQQLKQAFYILRFENYANTLILGFVMSIIYAYHFEDYFILGFGCVLMILALISYIIVYYKIKEYDQK